MQYDYSHNTVGPHATLARNDKLPAPGEAHRFLNYILRPGDVFELCALHVPTWRDRRDKVRNAVMKWPVEPPLLYHNLVVCAGEGAFPANAICIIPNPLDEHTLAKYPNAVLSCGAAQRVTDGAVARRRWLLLDIDPIRKLSNGTPVDGVVATEAERAMATQRGRDITKKLKGLDMPLPVAVDSGSGLYLMWSIDLAVDDDRVEKFVRQAHRLWSDEFVDVDEAVHNPGRLIRLPGTWNAKGNHRPEVDRGYRPVSILHLPDKHPFVSDQHLDHVLNQMATMTPIRQEVAAQPAKPSRDDRGSERRRLSIPVTQVASRDDLARARECLRYLKPSIPRDQWARVGFALASVGEELRDEWHDWSASTHIAGQYDHADAERVFDDGLKRGDVKLGTLIQMAQEAGMPAQGSKARTRKVADGRVEPIDEKPVVLLPGGDVRISDTAAKLGELFAATKQYFFRGGCVHREVGGMLHLIEPVGMASEFEHVATLARSGKHAVANEKDARLITKSQAFREALPRIDIIAPCPVLMERDGRLVNVAGYDHDSGVLAKGKPVLEPDLPRAKELLNDLLSDFQFASEGDRARALASIITPALVMGGLLPGRGRAPIDMTESDASQAGKGYRVEVVAAVYGQEPATVTQPRGGVGSFDETFATRLIEGRPFVCLQNLRGRIDSPALESFMTEPNFLARALRQAVVVNPQRYIIQATTNKADLTRDLANRCSVVRICKRPDHYQFRRFHEGSLLSHVRANQPLFLGAVFAIVRAWYEAGKPSTNEGRHDFRDWCGVLDWMCQNILGTCPIMDGHRETQERTANPVVNWLRDVAIEVQRQGMCGRKLYASDLLEIIHEHPEIEVPGIEKGLDITDDKNRQQALRNIGKRLSRSFNREQEDQSVVLGSLCVRRLVQKDNARHSDAKAYVVEEVGTNAEVIRVPSATFDQNSHGLSSPTERSCA